MDKKQFETICKKLDKISIAIAVQSIENKDDKIYALKKAGMTSSEVAMLVGMTESGVRDNKGWKRK
ncbi:hypothetical protein HYT56_02145 [Candidatus Woesearchaeota archaeon]|nr:hypothetical protein [Candidatus Woesearchaeota archaeon]